MFFDVALLWQPEFSISTNRRRECALKLPSWSWVSWKGKIHIESWNSGCFNIPEFARFAMYGDDCYGFKQWHRIVSWIILHNLQQRVINHNFVEHSLDAFPTKPILSNRQWNFPKAGNIVLIQELSRRCCQVTFTGPKIWENGAILLSDPGTQPRSPVHRAFCALSLWKNSQRLVREPKDLSRGSVTCTLLFLYDALCINQGDLEERGQQVQLMGKIFSRSSTTLLWLGGAAHSDVKDIQSLVADVNNLVKPDLLRVNGEWEKLLPLSLTHPIFEDKRWMSFSKMTHCEWFKRV